MIHFAVCQWSILQYDNGLFYSMTMVHFTVWQRSNLQYVYDSGRFYSLTMVHYFTVWQLAVKFSVTVVHLTVWQWFIILKYDRGPLFYRHLRRRRGSREGLEVEGVAKGEILGAEISPQLHQEVRTCCICSLSVF